jgi:Protein of unknown function (DUF3108)
MSLRIELAMLLFAKASFPGTLLLLIAVVLITTGASDAQTALRQQNEQTAIQASQPQIVPPPQNYRFPNGKIFVFTAEWHVFTAGTATIKLEPEGAFEKLTMAANSSGTVNLLFPVRDVFETQIDPRTYCTARIFKHAEEGKRKRETQIQIDLARRKSILDEKNLQTGATKHEENDVPGCTTDVISGFFYVASLPLQPGAKVDFPVTDGGKTTLAAVHVEGREQIKVPAGTFQTVRVSVEATTGKLQGKGQLMVWFTDDAGHMPVQMRAKVQWGNVMFRLQRVEN